MQPSRPKYHHKVDPIRSDDDLAYVGGGYICTDVVDLSAPHNQGPRIIRYINHPLDDRDGDRLIATWSQRRREKLQSLLAEITVCRDVYWEQRPVDDRRHGRKEAQARAGSVNVIERAIARQEDKDRRIRRLKTEGKCVLM